MLKRTPNMAPPAELDEEYRGIIEMVSPLRDTPDTMIMALDAMLDYYLETTVNHNTGPYVPCDPATLRPSNLPILKSKSLA